MFALSSEVAFVTNASTSRKRTEGNFAPSSHLGTSGTVSMAADLLCAELENQEMRARVSHVLYVHIMTSCTMPWLCVLAENTDGGAVVQRPQ